MRRSPLKARRETPRRSAGRVTHERMKPKRAEKAKGLERIHLDRIAAIGCLVCGAPAQVHHVKAKYASRRRDHKSVAPLCESHHTGHLGLHGLGSNEKFECLYDIDLVAWAQQEWSRTEQGT